MSKYQGRGSVGASTSIIIDTRSEEQKNAYQKKGRQKNKRAKTCMNCPDNEEGFCKKYKEWCTQVNYICTGEKGPYYNTSPIKKKGFKKQKKKDKKKIRNKQHRDATAL